MRTIRTFIAAGALAVIAGVIIGLIPLSTRGTEVSTNPSVPLNVGCGSALRATQEAFSEDLLRRPYRHLQESCDSLRNKVAVPAWGLIVVGGLAFVGGLLGTQAPMVGKSST